MIKEEWKVLDFIGYYNYAISNWGRVKSLNYKRTGKERLLRTVKDRKGYLRVVICKDGKRKCLQVHRLVAMAFLPNPDNLPEVNHKNEDKTDNRVENLEFCTHKYNINWGTRNEKVSKALTGRIVSEKTRNKNGKTHSKPVNQYTKDGLLIASYPSLSEVFRQTGFHFGNISKCCLGKYKQAYGYIWKFAE